MFQFLKRIGLIPEHTELSIYLTAITFILLLISDNAFRSDFRNTFDFSENASFAFLWIMTIGFPLSLYHVFSKRKKTDAESLFVSIFAAAINSFVAYSAVNYLLAKPYNFLILFPVLNFFNAIFLVLYLWIKFNSGRIGHIEIHDAERNEIIFGTIAILIIFAASSFVFKYVWPVTFSICTVYAMNLNEFVNKKLLPSLKNKR